MIDLVGKRYYFFALSLLIIIAGVIGYVAHKGFNLDIQFQGGTVMELNLTPQSIDKAKADALNVDSAKLAALVKSSINKDAIIQKAEVADIKNPGKFTVNAVLNISSSQTLTNDEQTKVKEVVAKEYNLTPSALGNLVNSVDPFIGKETMNNGLKAVIVASFLIIIYIWWRFRIMSGLSAGVFAVLALLHDGLIMLSVYTIFNIVLNESFIAAILTIIGYSMNDTIIIYDRIRENSNLLRKVPIAELVNKSIMQTLARSINTVVTVLISITTVYIFARVYSIKSIEDFSFPLIIGIASGCYSSIFIASPLWVMWKQSQAKKKLAGKPAKA